MTFAKITMSLFQNKVALVITLLAITFLVKLGFWQLDRAEEKRQLFADFNRVDQRPVNLDDPNHEPLQRFDLVSLAGSFTDNRYFLLDNQILNGKPGYQIIGLLTPTQTYQTHSTDSLVLVNLGWVPVGLDRRQLPQVTLPTEPVTVVGRFYQPLQEGFTLTDQVIEPSSWPQRIQHINFAALEEATQLSFAPYVVLLSEQESYGWPRQWQPQVIAPEKHQAYAVQWFSLAFACLLVFIFASRSKKTTTEE